MAVKQKVIECVGQAQEARLQIILRALEGISAQDGLQDKICVQIVKSLGSVPIPSNAVSYMKFIEDITKVRDILAKEFCNKKHTFIALKALYDEISNPDPERQPSPAMSIVLQLIDQRSIPHAVKYILGAGYPEQNLERAIHTLCNWLKKCAWAENLGPLVLAFMEGLEAEQHYEILIDVALAEIEPLFKLLMFHKIRKAVGPIVLYMLSRNQNNPQVFHKIIPLASTVFQALEKEGSESSMNCLYEMGNLLMALMNHFPDYPELYQPLTDVLLPRFADSDCKQVLRCKSWEDASGSYVQNKYFVEKVGLTNLGNTCYMNSVLQALFMTKTFRNEVLLCNNDISQLFIKLQELFALLQFSNRAALSPNDILDLARPPGFIAGQQHDSSEFLGFLLDTLHEQENNFIKMTSASEDEGAAAVTPTVVQQSFGGKTLTVSRCGECGTQSERIDNFRDLQLSFPNRDENQTVQTLLEYYLQPEKLTDDNKYHCEQCSRLTDSERITRIMEPPTRLTLTLKHFHYDPASHQRTKLLQTVALDEHLTLDNCRYELYAVVVHCGSSLDSGHYYTLAKDKSNWFKFNDYSVTKAAPECLSRLKPPETPYILFYSREDVSDMEDLPAAVLPPRLQLVLGKDNAEFKRDRERRSVKLYSINQDKNDEPPPPGCGGGGFSASSGNMFVC
nr:ubiquitin carboxyl-terminal hydrolase 35 isoform X2 [Leptinotarsa decemlineata]